MHMQRRLGQRQRYMLGESVMEAIDMYSTTFLHTPHDCDSYIA